MQPRFLLFAFRNSPERSLLSSSFWRKANSVKRITFLFLRRAAGGSGVPGRRVGIRSRIRVPVDRILVLRTLESDSDLLVDLVDVVVSAVGLESVRDHLHSQGAKRNAVEVCLPFPVRLQLETGLHLFAVLTH